jgi:hypothetical protein
VTRNDDARALLTRMLAEIAHERAALERIVDDLAIYAPRLPTDERPLLAVVAVDLHDYFTALESIFERIARAIDRDVPTGPESHRELVDRMATELEPLRPALLSEAQRSHLHELRSFRHFFRHGYGVPLDGAKLHTHARRVLADHDALSRALDDFREFLGRARDAVERP